MSYSLADYFKISFLHKSVQQFLKMEASQTS